MILLSATFFPIKLQIYRAFYGVMVDKCHVIIVLCLLPTFVVIPYSANIVGATNFVNFAVSLQ